MQASAVFFKTKLTSYNFTVFDLATKHACCYWFDETSADFVASMFASCLLKYLEENCKDDVGPIIIYSYGCCYQNRNAMMGNALLSHTLKKKIVIIQKYLAVGHIQMECDSVHAMIERYLKGHDI